MTTIKQTQSEWENFEKSNPQYKAVHAKYKQGLANYLPDSYGVLRDRSAGLQGTAGAPGAMADLLASFSGDQKNLKAFMQTAAPFMAAEVANTPEWAVAQRGAQPDLMQQQGAVAGQIGQAGSSAATSAGTNLNRSGLGASGALAGIQSQIAQQVGGDQANVFTNLYQQQTAQSQGLAQQRLDNQMHLAALAGGHNPQASGGAGSVSLAPAIGQLAMGIGSLVGGFAPQATQGGASSASMKSEFQQGPSGF